MTDDERRLPANRPGQSTELTTERFSAPPSIKATGGSYSKIFGDAPRSLSWDNIPWLTRTVSIPASEAR